MEERFQAVKIALGEGIEFVVVTARAIEGLGEPDGGGGLHAIGGVLGKKLFRRYSALLIDHVVAVEARRDALIERRLRQQVPGDLLDGELIETHVRIERPDHPVAPRMQGAVAIHLVAIRVGEAGPIQPVHSQSFAEMRRCQQSIHHAFEGSGRGIIEEGIRFRRSGRQPRQVERDPADERRPIRLGCRGQILRSQSLANERIHGMRCH